MCDTLVALGNSTASGHTLFAKNSDREPNEAQGLLYLPRALHRAQESVRCTYVDVPQVRETCAVLLSRPFWMFGCEMGANEHGVVIGNEAVFTKMPLEETGLLGMDLMRLALERADSAPRALDLLIELLERHGQGGAAGYRDKKFRYHNAFLIADAREAWVLETAGREWAAEQVRDVRSISNGLSIGREWDRASSGLVRTALERRWCRSAEEFDFARCYSEPVYTYFSASSARQCRTTGLLQAGKGALTPAHLMSYLSDHGPGSETPGWSPERGLFMQVCAHGAWGPIRGGGAQTTGSMVSELTPDSATHWLTGTSAPCTSLFKPFSFRGWAADRPPDSALGPEPGAGYDARARWWAHERLHRATLEDYPTRHALYQADRSALQSELIAGAGQELEPDFTVEAFRRADEAEAAWTRRIEGEPARKPPGRLYRSFWKGQSKAAGMPRA